MWTRKELKERAKQRFTKNYWKAILAALIMTIALSGSSHVENRINSAGNSNPSIHENADHHLDTDFEFDDPQELKEELTSLLYELREELDPTLVGVFFVTFTTIFIICMLIGSAIKVFLLNPLSLGGYKFFVDNLNQDASLNTFGFAFSQNYKNCTWILFLRDLFNSLWYLLFIVPGIIKSYEYRMIPYLLTQNPTMSREEAFETSKNMMMGNKWNAFVLDLSFIGWKFLSLFTCGILNIFYVNPYIYQTSAALFERLSTPNGALPLPPTESYIEVE